MNTLLKRDAAGNIAEVTFPHGKFHISAENSNDRTKQFDLHITTGDFNPDSPIATLSIRAPSPMNGGKWDSSINWSSCGAKPLLAVDTLAEGFLALSAHGKQALKEWQDERAIDVIAARAAPTRPRG